MRVAVGTGSIARGVRRGAAVTLDTVGRTAIAVAGRVSPAPHARRPRPSGALAALPRALPTLPRTLPALPRTLPVLRSAAPKDDRIDARSADIADLRRLALEVTIAAANDPSRPAYDRLTQRTVNLSEWAAGRLLGEAERMRHSAVAAVAAGSGDGKLLARRQFDPALRRQFPWLDDATSARLFDHGVIVASRIRADVPAPEEPAGTRSRIGTLVGRLRSR